jgi:aminoglycoside phosphotransferase (APT) family kinase protein
VRPDLADAPLILHTAGWESDAVEAGGSMFRFPKDPTQPERLRREAQLLALIGPRVPMPVPDMRLHEAPVLFSEHRMIPGEMIETPQYEVLNEAQRQAFAEKLAGFYAALHAIPVAEAIAVGAVPKPGWLGPAELVALADDKLEPELRDFARRVVAAYAARPKDDSVLGFFDGHGWNMAFDHQRGVLNGLYDFADSGIGERHRDFGYSSFISFDLTERIVTAYERHTGLAIDRRLVALHSAVQRIAELTAYDSNPAFFIGGVTMCRDHMQPRDELRV